MFRTAPRTSALRVTFARLAMSTSSSCAPPLVTCHWLREEQQRSESERPKVIDASWYLPAMKRDGHTEFLEKRIPSATFFDVDGTDDNSGLPHMLPSASYFSRAMDKCGVTNADHVIVYDGKGLFSAGRLWWMLRAFGHERVSVLDGGLPAWVAEGFDIESGPVSEVTPPESPFSATLQPGAVIDAAQILAHVSAPEGTKPMLVVDARASDRFEGAVKEARPGCRSGHIPGSRNVPFAALLDAGSGKMRPAEELRTVMSEAGVALDEDGPLLVTSCGSGVTAAVVQLALAQLGRTARVSLYDGSWAEWGSDANKPLATGPASYVEGSEEAEPAAKKAKKDV